MRSDSLARLVELSKDQAGTFSADQAVSLGISRKQVRTAHHAGVLQRIHPSVYWLGGGRVPRPSLVHAAVLAVGGGVPSHESSLFLHGVDRVPFVVAISTGPGARTDLPGVRIHRVRDLVPPHLCIVDGLVTTTIERALVDVTSVFAPVRTEWLLDQLTITTRRTSIGRIGRVLRQVNRRGRRGIGTLATLLDERRPSDPTPRSRLERSADELLALTGLPPAEREYPLPSLLVADGGPVEGFVDRAWPDVQLIVEVDGRPWHARERDMARDRRRDRRAAAAGWQTLRILDEEVSDVPDEVVADIVAAHAERRVLLRRGG
ncbi:type IV toxin-antitoxin system AbiEi family antitoxin domain-containing protein [Dermatobacter hominis]|uniref:type IV toxin-antitoxin system AbiEi family antitoxin domain-containing protein n=1 Tax=Dermatobacter hominis TaxID=2884263 RepID=UPI001D0F5586|nr:type IV toxin-antitoxin system AbiEi family antitoxin domain-containing protein [Dermatobacter hominis]UDY34989.1 type IV toxin-antitoxin system AbiEi family antitoxin domain-containing protein [Dermatobacter hominis]